MKVSNARIEKPSFLSSNTSTNQKQSGKVSHSNSLKKSHKLYTKIISFSATRYFFMYTNNIQRIKRYIKIRTWQCRQAGAGTRLIGHVTFALWWRPWADHWRPHPRGRQPRVGRMNQGVNLWPLLLGLKVAGQRGGDISTVWPWKWDRYESILIVCCSYSYIDWKTNCSSTIYDSEHGTAEVKLGILKQKTLFTGWTL